MTTDDVKDPVPPLRTRAVALMADCALLFPLALGIASAGIPEAWLVPALAFVYFAAFPMTPWQATPGKRIVGIRLCDGNGAPLGWRASLLRSGTTVAWCYLPTLVFAVGSRAGADATGLFSIVSALLFLAWAAALLSAHRQTLFDRLAGTFVVYRLGAGSTRQEQVTSGRRRSVLVVSVIVVLGIGALSYVAIEANEDHDRRARVSYAIGQIAPAQEKMLDFFEREKRWPTPAEAGIPEWNPYPAGGGYRVQSGGTIVISFSERPGLKGHSILARLKRPGESRDQLRWTCEPDPGFERKYLPAVCR
jgi:uncharacterized RDD family membrane protein YckC